MKKILVSSVIVVSFIAYSWYQRLFGAQTSVLPQTISIQTPKISQTVPISTPTTAPTVTQFPVQNSKLTQSPTTPPTNIPAPTATIAPTPTTSSGLKDGTYVGDAEDAFYGNIQVQATISQGKITNVQFLQAPNDRGTSIEINAQADPLLAQEAIQAQSAQVDVVSGATDSSNAFVQSLQTALDKAKS